MNQRADIPVIPPNHLVNWCGLLLQKDPQTDTLRARDGDFEWEVEATMNDDDEYEARVSHKGIKLAMGAGKTRHAALTQALQGMSVLETKLGNQAFARREGGRAYKNNSNRRP
jgi:hypothetical protein